MSVSAESVAGASQQTTRYRIFIQDDSDTITRNNKDYGVRVTNNIADRVTVERKDGRQVTMTIRELCNLPRTKLDYDGPVYRVNDYHVMFETEKFQTVDTSEEILAYNVQNASTPIAAYREIRIYGVLQFERSGLRLRVDTVSNSFDYENLSFDPTVRIRFT